MHELILFYSNGGSWTWNPIYVPYDKEYVERFYRYTEPGDW